jgi:hypothetical protein
MDLHVAQGCPQCGAPVDLAESDQILSCSYCGSCNVLQAQGPFRYVLPHAGEEAGEGVLFAPYLRFKGTIFLVSDQGIEHRVIDTTQVATPMPGLPPSLGLRPQAMGLHRLAPEGLHRYLPQSIRANAILEKAASVGELDAMLKQGYYHRAYIGESLSYIYLPITIEASQLRDAINGRQVGDMTQLADFMVKGKSYKASWAVKFKASTCPYCGDMMEGAGNSRVLLCESCESAWALGAEGFKRIDWYQQAGGKQARLYLPFWKITAHIPVLSIYSFADFIVRTNQPMLPRPRWRERAMSFWIPAMKLRPKIFLQAGRQVTLGQWLLRPEKGRPMPNRFPVTLPASEALQAVKVMLATCTASDKNIYPHLPQVRLTETMMHLVYLPCSDRGHDWVQPDTSMTIPKNILKFGRSM